MKVVVAGSKDRGKECLEALLHSKHQVTGVITVKDEDLLIQTSMFELAQKNSITTIRPKNPNTATVKQFLKRSDAQLMVLAGYGKMLKPEIFNLPKHGSINLHASPLPNYRGASPMNWMILNGETDFAISIIQVASGVDTGDILAQKAFRVDSPTIDQVVTKANHLYPKLLVKVIDQIESGEIKRKPQSVVEGFQMTRRYPKDGLILWDQMTAQEILQLIKGLQPPYPTAFTFFNRTKIEILEARLPKQIYKGVPGRVAAHLKSGVVVIAKDTGVLITKVNLNKSLKKSLPPTGKDLLTVQNFIQNSLGM